MNKTIIGMLRIFSYWIAISMAITMYLTIWVQGTLRGTYAVIAYTNLFGEHYFELALFGVSLSLALCFLILDFNKLVGNIIIELDGCQYGA